MGLVGSSRAETLVTQGTQCTSLGRAPLPEIGEALGEGEVLLILKTPRFYRARFLRCATPRRVWSIHCREPIGVIHPPT